MAFNVQNVSNAFRCVTLFKEIVDAQTSNVRIISVPTET